MKHIEVVAAVILHNNKILCVQRNEHKYDYISLKYEFPGGKLEPDETKEHALIREIKEELELDIKVLEHFLTVEHEYPDFKITMHSFICSCENTLHTLTEHINSRWFNKELLLLLDWSAADIPIVEKITRGEDKENRVAN